MRIFVTSDLHFGHKSIKKFCPITRSKYDDDTDRMNEQMILEWNEKVAPEDLTYILGDVAFMSGYDASKYIRRLNGRKILVEGNHDRKTLMDKNFRESFEEVHKYLTITYNKHYIIMSHFPFLEWDSMHRGSLHFFGHLHGGKTNQEHYRCKDVGMDATGEIVILLDDAVAAIENNEIKRHH
jgi:calcineurin-like phosphoesterase family protein